MTVFADSSAIVKLYVPEAGHPAIRAVDQQMIVSVLARVEIPAAFWGKCRAGEIDEADAATLTAAFEFDYHGDDIAGPAFAIVPATDAVLVEAARQTARHRLRAYDAVQLGSAIVARGADPSIDTIAVFDTQLRRAAVTEGFAILSG